MSNPIQVVVSADGSLKAGLVTVEPAALQARALSGVSREAMQERGLEALILDVSQIEEVNSSDLAYLVKTSNVLPRGRSPVLIGLRPQVRVMVEMLGLNAVYELVEDFEGAFAYLARPPRVLPERSAPVYGAPPPRWRD